MAITTPGRTVRRARTPRLPGFLMGVGLGGFFHVGTWILVAVATFMTVRLWQRGEFAPPWGAHVGMLLAGWGAFNVVEGLIDHQILGLHHVRDDLGAPLGWDLGFLALGTLLVAGGLALARDERHQG